MSRVVVTSVPGRRGGFTLIELLVVISILALLLIGASDAVSAGLPGLRLRAATRILADDLRATRRAALLQQHEAALLMSIGSYVSGADGRRQALPNGAQLHLAGAGGAVARDDRVRFFADGSSSGGRIELRLGGARGAIAIDWLTGRVQVDE